ncbi:MAG TPA: alpha/beta hydrolase [Tepidisphaeraceae bacterium]|nr:alpha/beta hydrolase [Tepidisphaeraceae bacterium]
MTIKEIEYANIAGESLLLDVRPPRAGSPGPHAAVVVIHGGGWTGGNRRDDLPFLDALADAGLVVFSIEYRLAPKHRWPACMDDVQTAIAWVTLHAAEHGADASRLGLIGYSAGGHLACHAAVIDRSPNIAAVALLAAPTDHVLDNFRRGGLSPSLQQLLGKEVADAETIETLWRISPINHVVPGLPPFLLMNGTHDQSVPHAQSAHLHQRLSDLGVKSDLVTLEGAEHRIRNWPQANAGYREQLATWMKQTLASPTRQ